MEDLFIDSGGVLVAAPGVDRVVPGYGSRDEIRVGIAFAIIGFGACRGFVSVSFGVAGQVGADEAGIYLTPHAAPG